MCFDSNVNIDKGRESHEDNCSHQMLAQVRKIIAEIFAFVDFHLYYNEPDSPHGDLFEGGGLFVRKQLECGIFTVYAYITWRRGRAWKYFGLYQIVGYVHVRARLSQCLHLKSGHHLM